MRIAGLLLSILLPLFLAVWAYEETSGLRNVLDGAVETQGVVEKIVAIEGLNRRTKQKVVIGHRVYVKLKTPSGEELVKPLQYEVNEPYGTVIDINTTTRYYTINETIPILYNPNPA